MSKDVHILAIESSCDETAVAILRNEKDLLVNLVSSQIETHKKFGGVIPEVASRLHVEAIAAIIEQALKEANLKMEAIDAIAVTQGPGLIGCLHVGNTAAKTLAWFYDKPLITVHHIAGHIYANNLVTDFKFPVLALVVSGGHSELDYLESHLKFKVISSTQDDAIGEAYDKVARILGLAYPGGPVIDKLAKNGSNIYSLPKVKMENELDFSFSGIKSAILQFDQRMKRNNQEYKMEDLACSFQENVLNQVMERVEKTLNLYPVNHFVIAGGVAANSALRNKVLALKEKFPNLEITIPPMYCCTDNAAMIAAAAYFKYLNHDFTDLDYKAHPNLNIE